ncbi:hypothetical protein BVRB_6g151400 [Beta vulgaris subsp. vulgaris]|nr:hypothetical protein BVRB_6g151400 [Beta vulgaris subsp. vulgaris]
MDYMFGLLFLTIRFVNVLGNLAVWLLIKVNEQTKIFKSK